MLADRSHALAEVDLATLGKGRQPDDLGRAPPSERDGATGGPLGERPQREAAQSGLRALEGVGSDRHRAGAGPCDLERLQHDPFQEMRVLDQLGLSLGDVPLGRRAQLLQGRQHLGPHSVAGVVELEVGLIVGERQARLGRQAARLGTLELEQWPHYPAALRRQPAKRSRSGRDGEAVQHRLGEVGPRVAGRDPVAAGAGAKLLRGGVSRIPRRGLEVSREVLRPLDVEVDAESGAKVAADALVAIR